MPVGSTEPPGRLEERFADHKPLYTPAEALEAISFFAAEVRPLLD